MDTRDFHLRSHPLVPVDGARDCRRSDDEIIGAFWVGFGFGAMVLAAVAFVAWWAS